MRPDILPSVLPLSARLAVIRGNLRASGNKLRGGNAFDDLPTPVPTGPPETFAHLPAIFDPDHLDRVISCGFDADRSEELAKLRENSFTGTPGERYSLGESIIIGGTILSGRARHFLRNLPEMRNLMSDLLVHDQATLTNTQQGLHYFGHWLQDDCPLYEAVKYAPNLLSITRPDWPDRHFYESGFGQTWTETRFAYVGDLTVWRDLSYSADKVRRMQTLRARLRQGQTGHAAGRIIYISRGSTGEPRNMSNVTDFEDALRKAGIEVVEPGQVGSGFLDARMVIAIEGSQACHGLYALAGGGAFLIIQPPERFYNPLRNWSSLLGFGYGIVVGQKDAVSFHVTPEEVLRIVDRLLARPSPV
jgi:hypothetical protein